MPWRCCATPRPASAPLLGRRVVVYGGGNTAMDAARSVRRLGAEEALIVYRRDRAHMPAHEFEADEALAEGVKIKWLTTIKEIVGPTLTVERMTLDDKGRPQPTGELETLRGRRRGAGARPGQRQRLPAQACRASNSSGTRWWWTGR